MTVFRALSVLLMALVTLVPAAETLVFRGAKELPASGKKIVLVAGDEEYRSEETMPMLAKILSQHHGFDCTVIFSWDETGTYIDPNNPKGLKGLEALDQADLMIIGTRFRDPSTKEAAHLTAFLNAGKPVIGLRTSTHAFKGEGDFGGLSYNEFGRKIIGEEWVAHHGSHKVEGGRGVLEETQLEHPILNSIEDVFSYSDIYTVSHLVPEDTVLMRGAVTASLDPESERVEGKKNDPMQAVAWLHPYTAPNGETEGQTFGTTMGASVDFVSEDLRRVVVNAALFLTGLEVPPEADVSLVDPFDPAFYGFVKEEGFWKKQLLTPASFELGKSTKIPDGPGAPEWKK